MEEVGAGYPNELDLIQPASNSEYINKISKRLNEDAHARLEREKRRRKVLVDQLRAHEAQEVRNFYTFVLHQQLSLLFFVLVFFCKSSCFSFLSKF